MYLAELTVSNFKSFRQSTLKLSQGINILTGQNNSGKSSIIRAVYCLQSRNSISISDVRKGNHVGRITCHLQDIDENDISCFRPTARSTASLRDSIVVETLLDKRDTNDPIHAKFYSIADVLSIESNGEVRLNSKYYSYIDNDFNGIKDSEDQNNFIYPFLTRRRSNIYPTNLDYKSINLVQDDFRSILSRIKKISNPSHPKHEEFIELCKKILGFSIGIIPQDGSTEHIGIYTSATDLISIEQMGDGVVHIIGLISLLLTEDKKLYLIEELENDLHPQALKQLLELILTKANANQFIVSTHSNIVVRYLGTSSDCKILETTVDFDHHTPTSAVTEITNKAEDRIKLLQKLGYDPWDFDLFSAYLILEESSAERLIRDFLIPTFVPSLKDKLKTVAAQGATDVSPRLHDFLRLFVFIHMTPIYQERAWAIADGDDAGKKHISELRKKLPSWPAEHFLNFAKENFEDYYPDRFEEERNGALTDKSDRQLKKRTLLQNVMKWINDAPNEAKEEFQKSAKEVIDILKDIDSKLAS